MDLSSQVTNLIVNNHTDNNLSQPLVIGEEIELDGVTSGLFSVDPNVTTREEAEMIKEISDYAKSNFGDDFHLFIKDLTYRLGLGHPSNGIKRLYEYIKTKKSIDENIKKLEVI